MIMDLLLKLNQEENMTIIQVTHNENYAKYSNRIIRLEDGLKLSDTLQKLESLKENEWKEIDRITGVEE